MLLAYWLIDKLKILFVREFREFREHRELSLNIPNFTNFPYLALTKIAYDEIIFVRC